jgi:hypothetical protein
MPSIYSYVVCATVTWTQCPVFIHMLSGAQLHGPNAQYLFICCLRHSYMDPMPSIYSYSVLGTDTWTPNAQYLFILCLGHSYMDPECQVFKMT